MSYIWYAVSDASKKYTAIGQGYGHVGLWYGDDKEMERFKVLLTEAANDCTPIFIKSEFLCEEFAGYKEIELPESK